MKLKDLSREKLKALVQDTVEEALVELLGDPDYGLEPRKGLKSGSSPPLSSKEKCREYWRKKW